MQSAQEAWTAITHLECSRTGERFEAGKIHNLSTAGWPLLVRYDIQKLARQWDRDSIADDPRTMWRYAPLLPVRHRHNIVSLQEGFTPLHRLERLGERLECDDLWLKDEGVNPTATFKARGVSCAISMCRELGIRKVAIPTAGNAGGALAAYTAAAGIDAYVFMPRDVPAANFIEAKTFGAKVTLVDGLISDCAKRVAEGKATEGWYDLSTLKEPYRIEGKKTMGFEAAEDFGWELPDAIFYPTGGGVGMIGMWKAFEELEQLGWVDTSKTGGKRPKMYALQSAGCAPIARAYAEHKPASEFFQDAATFAAGLRVPKPYADTIILDIVRESGGAAIAHPDDRILASILDWAKNEGIFLSPEGAAATAAYDALLASGELKPTDKVV